MGRKPPVIPAGKLLEGCWLCLDNAMQFAKGADLLLRKGTKAHAYALVILGFQELGKFGILLESFVNAYRANVKKVEVKGFYDHDLKMRARMKHYLAEEKQLREEPDDSGLSKPSTREERHWHRVFESASFAKSVRMLERNGEGERLAATYVDFDERMKRWVRPRSPSREIIEANRRLLQVEALALHLTLRIKPPWVTLMAWESRGL